MKALAIALLALSFFLLPGLVMAQGTPGMGMHPGMGGAGMGMGPGMGMGSGRWASLNLSPDQIQKFQAMRLNFLKDTLPLRNQLGIKRIELRQLWLQPNPDQAQIVAKEKEINALRAQIQEKATSYMLQARSILTPDQQARMLANLNRFGGGYGMRKGMMGPGMMGGPGMMMGGCGRLG